jgi:acetate kinase
VSESIADAHALDAVGYLLYHGGEEIKHAVMRLSEESFLSVERCVPLLPEYNEITLKTARQWMTKLPDVPHYLLCDTAFFVELPPQASTYAVPYQLREKGIRRYGGYGLCHEWAWEHARVLAKNSLRRVVSVYLGNRTNAAAIENGKAIETSIGFTPVEGIMSASSCGDIDASVVFQLISAGVSLEEINRLLSRDSGLRGLLGGQSDFLSIAQDLPDPKVALARNMFLHSLRKYLGAFVSVLGGIDAIVFTSEHPIETLGVVGDVCRSLEFLGLRCMSGEPATADSCVLSEPHSRVQAFYLRYNRWDTIAAHISNFITKEV